MNDQPETVCVASLPQNIRAIRDNMKDMLGQCEPALYDTELEAFRDAYRSMNRLVAVLEVHE